MRFHRRRPPFAEGADPCHIEPEAPGAKRLQITNGQPQQPRRRAQPPTVNSMLRLFVLLAEMDKSSGDLDERFVEIGHPIGLLRFHLKPEMLQHIVRLVIALLLEALKIAEVARVGGGVVGSRRPSPVWGGRQGFDEALNAIVFFHSVTAMAL